MFCPLASYTMYRMKNLGIGIQDFETLIADNCIYVDKTEYIHKLIQPPGRYFFLARPRRFGKSLLVSTLRAIFLGKIELFRDCFIAKTDYTWPVHPVIMLDFSTLNKNSPQTFSQDFILKLRRIAIEAGIELEDVSFPESALREIVTKLSKRAKVVVLIDEYDSPILEHIENLPYKMMIVIHQ